MNTKLNSGKKLGLMSCAVACAIAALSSSVAMSDNGKHDNRGKAGKDCNATTIRGDYGTQMQGTRPAAPPNTGIETVIGVVWRSYDGAGNFEQRDNIKGSLSVFTPNRPGMGTYEVSPDCTGITTFQPDPNNPFIVIQERIVILDNGNEIRSITETPAPLMITSVSKRIN
ncbi:MAG: hypothetical protein KDI33_18815 [Halioglobus sp.]|nr:hypothetical protein [Halioglobus sp.]